ncbi:ATP-dependent helicase [Actinobacillus pleuropneumoniae]|uniref:RNA polymerase-associated protein RapA n=1 Tax=Actinobacillus pleuropneumoniae serotype 5b (strain L20) TaxID=416269 RepID=RAPA_ACTP2|nr:RNA polymerase-associated protein RapA [Actinobacillus pleuropneumoniae]A3MZ32.1 RecName: Full=RNA polymerase-associated protein RapA; AltName: Full=ATP-dependent helicase HepA [Actinobacillus pleuropneumoniae serovar 5b str. L20]ABN73418.1 ATP-dependent helicase HepA [Actinobacillus pleuropneumoniae serovar 5b str. L20]MEE3682129.1 RNA polymerase-associated protein RapA [Actinobacillus pleuropneumoniae]QSZ38293.1 ATP-dependent helicase [Actinobacillus pleuropneumoniae]UKH09473.1 RNA polyme
MFVVGQRWISESENNLGLGIVTASDNRTVTIQFPAAEEERIYALSVAPLTRVQFQKGDRINSVEGWQLDVEEVVENQGFIIYLGKRADSGEEAVLPEMQLDHKVSFSKPQDRLFSAQIDRSDRFALRYRALQHQQAQFQSPLRGMRGIRASLIPHQLHIAKEVGQRVAPRVLLADEVGLGKTIEAGMILQQQLFSGRVERVLVLVPESLQHQWLVEMLRRFNLKFSLFDEERCSDFDKADEDGNDVSENPFDSEALVIASIDWLESSPNRAKQVLASHWDMLIVDEAHHLAWSENEPSVGYQFVERLSKQTPAVLLLTATPEQLGQESHFARLALLDADRFYDYHSFIAEQKDYKPVADAVATLLNDKPLSHDEQNSIAELLSEKDTEPMFKVINSEKSKENDRLQVRQELIRELIDRHGTSRVLFRNTRQGVKGFPHRVYHQITLEMPSQYTNALKVMGMMGGVTKDDQLYPERLFQRMNPAAKWADFDPRIEWLITFLKNHRDEKILVICKQADTAIALEQILREREAIRSAVFHEKMSIVERDRASAYFAQMEEGAQVLISSSIGSEGRNFQFASNLVLFNLPDNPDLLEQSIGRLDRIGQKNDIQIHVPCFENSMQMVLATWYHQGLNAFEETCPMGAALFREFGEELEGFLKNPQAVGFDEFLVRTFKRQQQLKAELEQGRDRLLELNSNGGEVAQALAEAIAKEDNNPHLVNFALSLFDVIGLEQEDLGEQSIVISPTGHMLVPDFPGIAEDSTTVTFDRQLALMREDVEFLTWDHPMIRNGIDLITSGDIGKSAISLLINKHLPAGTLLLEAIYMVETQAPKGLNLTRFLPPTPVRILLGNKGNDMAAQVSFTGLEKQLKPVNKQMANKIAKMAQADIKKLIDISEQKIAAKLPELIEKASQDADSTLSAELYRLTSLQAVNKNIRADEIEALEQQRIESLKQIALANWRLDSLRVIVSNKE